MTDKPDISEIPDFEALRKWIASRQQDAQLAPVLRWIEKLESWCKAVHERYEDDGEKLSEQERRIEDLESQAAEIVSLIEFLDDIKRGIRTSRELYDEYVPWPPESTQAATCHSGRGAGHDVSTRQP